MATLTPAERRLAQRAPSYRDFVDDALFHPAFGHYSTGRIRFGEGGHYETFPLALSPLFGRMVARLAFRLWRRTGCPRTFELCELGAGNGQLCLDTLAALDGGAGASGDGAGDRTGGRSGERAWRRFAEVARYRIVERSPALIARQRALLGPLARRVRWTRADLSRRPARSAPFGRVGMVVANEVLDCLAHHRIVPGPDGRPRVVFVAPELAGRALSRAALARLLGAGKRSSRLRYREHALPLAAVPGLGAYVARRVPEILVRRWRGPAYFACPEIDVLVRHTGRLYRTAEMLWIDYGDVRGWHLRTPEKKRVFAGPPRSARSIYDAPGADDITFMVDFSTAAAAAIDAGLRVAYYGPQGSLARASGVRLDGAAVDLIARYRTLGWALGAIGLGPERSWRRDALTWTPRAARGGRLRTGIARDVAEFQNRRPTRFRLLVLETNTKFGSPSPWPRRFTKP